MKRDNPKRNKQERANAIIVNASQIFVVVWTGLSAWWTKPYFTEYYQKMANAHLEPWGAQLLQMGSVFVLAVFFFVHSLIHKRRFVAILTGIIAIWAFYWAFLASFVCQGCGV